MCAMQRCEQGRGCTGSVGSAVRGAGPHRGLSAEFALLPENVILAVFCPQRQMCSSGETAESVKNVASQLVSGSLLGHTVVLFPFSDVSFFTSRMSDL